MSCCTGGGSSNFQPPLRGGGRVSHLDLRHMEEVDCVLSIHHIFKCSPAVLFDQSLVIKFRKLYKNAWIESIRI